MKEMLWHKHYWPENVKKTLEYPNIPLHRILEDTADKSGELPYTVWSGTTTTYLETEEAANKTMGIVERYFEEEDDYKTHLENIKGHDEDVAYLRAFKDALDDNMTEILTAQQFQDITGQTIKKVINLVNSVEGELLSLITQFGLSDNPGAELKPNTVTYNEYKTEEVGSSPAEQVSQSDVESLLNDFGF
jgi:chemotaxis protein CheZ